MPIRAPEFRLRTFGTATVEASGRPLAGWAAQRKPLAVLALLAVAGGRGVSRDRVLAMLWPESDEERARGALAQVVARIRRELGDVIVRGDAELRLDPAHLGTDVADLRAAADGRDPAAVVALYTGPFLDGMYVRDAPEFERWVDAQRSEFAALHAEAVEALAAEASRRGDLQAAVRWWRERAALDPLSGRVARAYMEALAAAGDREAAIRHAATHAALVRAEHLAEPAAEVVSLADTLRQSAPTGRLGTPRVPEPASGDGGQIAPGPPPPGVSAGAGPPVPRRMRTAAVLVGLAIVGMLTYAAGDSESARARAMPVAVAPLRNRSQDPALASVAEELTDRLVRQLVLEGRVGVVDLRLPTSGGGNDDPVAAARRRNAEEVVVGDVYQDSDRVLVQVSIVNPADGRVIAQLDPVAAAAADVERLAAQVSDRVGGAVAVLADSLYQPWTTANGQLPTYSAFVEFRAGLDALVRRQDDSAARGHLRRAVALDPSFVVAGTFLLYALPAESAEGDSVAAATATHRGQLGPFDQAWLDRVVAVRDGAWEDAYAASKRMMAAGPHAPGWRIGPALDVQFFVADAAMATMRYREVNAVYHAMDRSTGWRRDFTGLTIEDLRAHHFLGAFTREATEWNDARAQEPARWSVCREGLKTFAAMGRERAVDSLAAICGALFRGTPDQPSYLLAAREYRAHGFTAAAVRAARLGLAEMGDVTTRKPSTLRALAMLQAELGDWRASCATRMTLNSRAPRERMELAVAAAHLGDTVPARAALRYFEEWGREGRRRGEDKELEALIVLALGERNRAVELLGAAIREGWVPSDNAWHVRVEFEPLRLDAGYRALTQPR